MKKMRDFWWESRDAAGALKMLHSTNNSVEAKLLYGLSSNSANDLVNALENVPRNMRLLYMHSYQSLLWNKAASRRVQFGVLPIVGDLVFVDETAAVEATAEEVPEEVESVDYEDKEEEEKKETKEEKKVDYKALVKPLTQADLDSGRYSIFDVVLPLPGHDISYPENEIGKYYEELLKEDGLSSEKLKQKIK